MLLAMPPPPPMPPAAAAIFLSPAASLTMIIFAAAADSRFSKHYAFRLFSPPFSIFSQLLPLRQLATAADSAAATPC